MSSPGRQNVPGSQPDAAAARQPGARRQASGAPGAKLSRQSKTKRRVVWSLIILLAILHQDFWLWENQSLLLGFLPAGMAYHIAFSITVAGLWALALRYAWPSDWEAWASPEPACPEPAERVERAERAQGAEEHSDT